MPEMASGFQVSMILNFSYFIRMEEVRNTDERPLINMQSSINSFGNAVTSLLDTTMAKAAETIWGNDAAKSSYALFDNALSALPVNRAQSSLSLQVKY